MEMLLPGVSAIQNVHPMFVHFPIAFFVGALAMEGLAVFRHEKFHTIAASLLYLGTLSAIVTVPTGFYAMNTAAETDPRGHNAPGHNFIHVHRDWMVSVTAVSILLSLYLLWIGKKKKWVSHRWGALLGLLSLSILLTLGADRGARLVYEFGTGISPNVLNLTPEENEQDHGH